MTRRQLVRSARDQRSRDLLHPPLKAGHILAGDPAEIIIHTFRTKCPPPVLVLWPLMMLPLPLPPITSAGRSDTGTRTRTSPSNVPRGPPKRRRDTPLHCRPPIASCAPALGCLRTACWSCSFFGPNPHCDWGQEGHQVWRELIEYSLFKDLRCCIQDWDRPVAEGYVCPPVCSCPCRSIHAKVLTTN